MAMKKRRIEKDFDDPAVQSADGPSLEQMWSEEAYALYGPPRDTGYDVGRWFEEKGIPSVLDVGCGRGVLREGYSGRWIGLDRSIEQLRQTGGTRLIGDALSLPFPDESFPGVTALYMLYFFEDPSLVVREALRVLQPDGWFATCAPSKFDAPELVHVTPKEEMDSFMAEDVPELLFEHFRVVDVTIWDFPAFDLPDRETVSAYLYSWYFPRLTREEASKRAEQVDVPLKLTKRGAWGVGHKPR
jgi:ubiquinone/menaquinone biosynthesis C-methylase UbiE